MKLSVFKRACKAITSPNNAQLSKGYRSIIGAAEEFLNEITKGIKLGAPLPHAFVSGITTGGNLEACFMYVIRENHVDVVERGLRSDNNQVVKLCLVALACLSLSTYPGSKFE
jgi:hypothetical protein